MKNLAAYQKDHAALEKEAKALGGELSKHLNEMNKQQDNIGALYKAFDAMKKKLLKPGKGEAEDKKAVAAIDGLLKDGVGAFKKLGEAVKELGKFDAQGKKMQKEADTLVKDLEVQAKMLAKQKSSEAKKFDDLLRTAKKTAAYVTGDIVKHRGNYVDAAGEQKDFEKELHKFADDVQSGKHREKNDADDWMEGALDPKKVAEATKRLKTDEGKADRLLGLIEGKLGVAQKKLEAPDTKLEQKAMTVLIGDMKKLGAVYAKAMKGIKPKDIKDAEKNAESKVDAKKLQAFLGELRTARSKIELRFKQVLTTQAKVTSDLKKAGVKV